MVFVECFGDQTGFAAHAGSGNPCFGVVVLDAGTRARSGQSTATSAIIRCSCPSCGWQTALSENLLGFYIPGQIVSEYDRIRWRRGQGSGRIA